jgi:hypothetical protein
MTEINDKERDESEKDDIALGFAILVILTLISGVIVSFYSSTDRAETTNIWLAAAIGFGVGSTEMMARYRDRPFLPMLSFPGLMYIGVNAGAGSLAYYLTGELMNDHLKIGENNAALSPVTHVLIAGFGAMAFFRSGVFMVKLGNDDVAIGPNLVLQILLQALDRSYDRQRASPRAKVTAQIMSGVSFAVARAELPAICFNLMQNVTQDEQTTLANQVEALFGRNDLGEDTKAMVLGLALLNIVGETTLRTAVLALGKTAKSSTVIERSLIEDLAVIEPTKALSTLPQVCNTLCHKSFRQDNPANLVAEISAMELPDENKAVLALYKLVQTYGPSTVSQALATMA